VSKPFRGHHPSRDCALPRGTAAVAAWRHVTHFEEKSLPWLPQGFRLLPSDVTTPAPGAGSPLRPARLDGLSSGECLLQGTTHKPDASFQNDVRICHIDLHDGW
jgi:hypothetical protein